jgi:hypothetical protein
MASLSDRLSRNPEPWKAEPGDVIEGTVVAVEQREGDYGPYPWLDIDADDGRQLGFAAWDTVARNEIVKLQPKPGDRIGIRCLGKVKGATRSYNGWKVVVEKPDQPAGAVDWSRMQKAVAAEMGDDRPADWFEEE